MGVPGDSVANAAAYAAEYAARASGSGASGVAEKKPGVFGVSPPSLAPGIVPGVPSRAKRGALLELDALGGGESTGFGKSGFGLASARLGPGLLVAGSRLFATEVDGVDALECDVTRWNTAGALTSAEPSAASKLCSSSLRSAPE
jgi:hypothetical protein